MKDQKGFTIIEVLIVLAVAGLITMIVFQAVPALQRNARNNQRKQDVAAILEAVSHYELNNSGAMPPDCGNTGDPAECNGTGNILETAKLGFYTDAAAGTDTVVSMQFYTDANSAPTTITNPNGINKVGIHNYQHCATNGNSSRAAAGFRDVVALYSLENGSGGPTTLCTEL